MSDSHGPKFSYQPALPIPNGKTCLWLFLSTEIMFFAGLIGTYIVLRFGAVAWPAPHDVHLSEPIGAFNTFVLICSSVTVVLALEAAKLNQAVRREVVQRVRLVGGDATAPDPTMGRDRPRRRLPQLSSAALPGARSPEAPRGGGPETEGEIGHALRSLAAKRAERIVADAEPARTHPRGNPQARPRRRW